MKKNSSRVKKAWFSSKPPQLTKSTGRSGKKYERKVLNRFQHYFPDMSFVDHPWIQWVDSSNKYHACEPDFLMIDEENKTVWIIEAKSWAWGEGIQDIRVLYFPIIKMIYPDYVVKGLVVNGKKGKSLNSQCLDEKDLQLIKVST